jgi:hypothetical protein
VRGGKKKDGVSVSGFYNTLNLEVGENMSSPGSSDLRARGGALGPRGGAVLDCP